MNKSRRLLFSWICLVSGFLSLFLGIGPVPFVVLVLAHCVFRYALQPRLPSFSLLRPWLILIFLLITVILVAFPAAYAMSLSPSFEVVFQSSFGPVFRLFQWYGASFLLLFVLADDLGRIREERMKHVD
jgi:hypothetical protein